MSRVNSQSGCTKGTHALNRRSILSGFLRRIFLTRQGRIFTVLHLNIHVSGHLGGHLCEFRNDRMSLRQTRGQLGDRASGLGSSGRPSARLLAFIRKLPELGLHGRSKGLIFIRRVNFINDTCEFIYLFLRNEIALAVARGTAAGAASSPTTSTGSPVPKSLEGRELAGLKGQIGLLVQVVGGDVKLHDRIKVLKHQAISQDSGLDGRERWVFDPLLKVEDLHFVSQLRGPKLNETCMEVVLLNMGSAILVKVTILAVFRVKQILEGRNDQVVHHVHPITPKMMGVEGPIGLAAVLGCHPLLRVLPAQRMAKQRMKNRPYLLIVSGEGRIKGSEGLKDLEVFIHDGLVPQDGGASN